MSQTERDDLTKVSDLLHKNPLLWSQLTREVRETITLLNSKLDSGEFRVAMSMIIATTANAIHYLIDNNILQYKE